MGRPAPQDPVAPPRWTVARYLRLIDDGVLGPDDRVELLDGVIVTMAPHDVPHAAGVGRVGYVLHRVVRDQAVVRIQLSLRLGAASMPEPDAAVLPGVLADYDHAHPTRALLVVEVADSSLTQDRLTKAAIYAAANVPEYWIVNLREDCVEVRRDPAAKERRYRSVRVARRGEQLPIEMLPGAVVVVDDVLPTRRRSGAVS